MKAALQACIVYSIGAAILVCLLLKPALGLFFTGDVDMSAMLPWAKTYVYLSVIFYIPLSTIFVFRNTMQALTSYPLACFCDPAAWFTAAVFTGVSYIFVMKDIRKKYETA